MRKFNILSIVFVLSMLFNVGFGFKTITTLMPGVDLENTTGWTGLSNIPEKNDKSKSDRMKNPTLEKADFIMTAESLDKEYTRKEAKSEDLEKYVNKYIIVTGKVTTITLEKKGRMQPSVTLFAPGILHGVSCLFDDEDAEQLKMLKKDKIVRIQGFQNDFVVPNVSPLLRHCVVLEAE